MFFTDFVADASDTFVGLFAIMIFLVADMIRRTEHNMIMDMAFINMRRNNVGIMPLQYFICELNSDAVCFFIRYFTRSK